MPQETEEGLFFKKPPSPFSGSVNEQQQWKYPVSPLQRSYKISSQNEGLSLHFILNYLFINDYTIDGNYEIR